MAFFNWKSGDDSPSSPTPPASESLRRKQEFCAYCDSMHKHYREMDNDPTSVTMSFGGGDFCFDHLICFIDFDPSSNQEGDNVHLYVPCVGRNFTGAARDRGIALCNKIVAGKRWIKPYIDKDGDLCVDADMYIGGSTAAEDTLNLVQVTMSIIDDVYEEVQQAARSRW